MLFYNNLSRYLLIISDRSLPYNPDDLYDRGQAVNWLGDASKRMLRSSRIECNVRSINQLHAQGQC